MIHGVTFPRDARAAEKTQIALTKEERYVLDRGLVEWGGPARCSEELAVAMGFADVNDLLRGDGARILQDLRHQRPLSSLDWTRALLATEIVFASVVMGSGNDWSTTTGIRDGEAIALLRALQSKIGSAGAIAALGARPNDPSRPRQTP